MLWLFYSLLVLFIAVLFAHFFGLNDGYIVMMIGDDMVSTSSVFFFVVLLGLLFLMYVLFSMVIKAFTWPKDMRRWRKYRGQKRAERSLVEGLTSMGKRDWALAEQSFQQAAKYSEFPYMGYLLAARAAQHQGLHRRRDKYLRLACSNDPGVMYMVGITQAELQLACQQEENALMVLSDLHRKQPDQIQAKRLLLETYVRRRQWGAVLRLLPEVKVKQALEKQTLRAWQDDAYAGLLIEAGEQGRLEPLNDCWDAIPREHKRQARLIAVYVGQRLRIGDTIGCEPLLKATLSKRFWDQTLVRLYGLVEGTDRSAQLAYMERFLGQHANDPVLLLSLARLSIKNELWGKAMGYLKSSIELAASPEAYYELANLYRQNEDHSQANMYYQQGLSLLIDDGGHQVGEDGQAPRMLGSPYVE